MFQGARLVRPVAMDPGPGPSRSSPVPLDPPGFKRSDVLGRPITYLTNPEPGSKQVHRVFYRISQVKDYLQKTGLRGGELDDMLKKFDFKKYGERKPGDDGGRRRQG